MQRSHRVSARLASSLREWRRRDGEQDSRPEGLITVPVAAGTQLAVAHKIASELEEELCRRLPEIADVVVRTEPSTVVASSASRTELSEAGVLGDKADETVNRRP
jgi:hypothetical protein